MQRKNNQRTKKQSRDEKEGEAPGVGPDNGFEHSILITIDDLTQQAEELASGLRQLRDYKHPLGIRRGTSIKGKGVSDVTNESKTVKAGARTYFFDLKETKEGKPYLTVTESRFKGEDEERERNTIVVFPENAEAFTEAITTMADKLN